MAYFIANGDFVKLQMVGRLHGQQIRNVFTYKCSFDASFDDGQTLLNLLMASFDTQVWLTWREAISAEYTLETFTAQVVKPVRYRLVALSPAPETADGAVNVNSLPSTVAAVVKRYAQRAGRKYQGRVFIAGIPETYDLASLIDPVQMPKFDDIATDLRASITPAAGKVFVPWLNVEGTDVALQQVVNATATNVLRVQRRREVGRGE